jgi:PAS domain S-box-containing protein
MGINGVANGAASGVKKILLADDSPVVSKVLSMVLRGGGYEVVLAADGIEATQAVYNEMPDLIVLDIFMPRMNGYQVCRLLKHDPAVAHIPVIINTASEGRSAEFWSRHTGADAFMLKGSPPRDLLALIASTLEGRGPHPKERPRSPGPEEILSKVSALADAELHSTTIAGLQLKTILDNLCEGIMVLNEQGCVSSANHFLCRMLGTTEPEILGKDAQQILGEHAGQQAQILFERALQGAETQSVDSSLSDGHERETPVSINVAPLNDYLGEVVGCVALFQDITRRKQIEGLIQIKNDLTDMIIHDLRTPLTSVLTGLQSVEMLGEVNADQKELLGISIDGGQVLLGMINDLLDISKMEDGSLHIERRPLDVAHLVERAVRQVSSLALAKGVTLERQVPADLPSLCADEDKLVRMLVNLLSNAIKFTPQGGRTTLGANFVARPDRRDSVVFVCRDTGEGIPADAFERIFEKFGQVETRQAGRKMSSGLGLTFCRMVTIAHGGRIWVESELGVGSAFSFAIPAVG